MNSKTLGIECCYFIYPIVCIDINGFNALDGKLGML